MLHPVLLAAVLLGLLWADVGNCTDKAAIEGGVFTPFYSSSKDPKPVKVPAFLIDKTPVTNKLFSDFTNRNPQWKRGQIPPLYSDEKYLKHWEGDTPQFPNAPVVNVSWFAAEAFCVDRGGRLPTVLEWEYVAAASENKKDAARDPEFVQRLLGWYAAPGKSVIETPVGNSRANVWGVYDMHGLVWEWTSDFNSVFLSGDNRREGESMKNAFCGDGAFSATDKANYAAFMRYAMRSSLKGEYTGENLGFRCAYDVPVKNRRRK